MMGVQPFYAGGAMTLEYPREMFSRLFADPVFASQSDEAKRTWLKLIDTVFFASLMLEEGEHVPIVVVHEDHGCSDLATRADSRALGGGPEVPFAAWRTIKLSERDFSPRELVKLARGLRYGHHVVVAAGRAESMRIDGIAQRVSGTDGGEVTLVAAPRPGVLVLEQAGREFLRFEEGEERPVAPDVLGEPGPVLDRVRRVIGAGAGKMKLEGAESTLQELLAAMRATRAGGMLVMTPTVPGSEVLKQVKYRFEDPMLLAKVLDEHREALIHMLAAAPLDDGLNADELEEYGRAQAWRQATSHVVTETVNILGMLSAIDGALLLGPGGAVYGAGFIIKSSSDTTPPVPVLASDVAGRDLRTFPGNVGARHSAAFAFANEHHDALVFVISEDGPVRAAMWTDEQGKVIVWPVRVPEI